MTQVNLEEDEIFLGFTIQGSVITARGIANTEDYSLETAFVVPRETPLFRLSDYQGYAITPENWVSVKIEKGD